MGNHTTERDFVDLEIRIFQRRDEGYPVEITLGGQQEFPQGYLAADILPWAPSDDPADDGRRLFDALLADSGLRSAWAESRGRATQRRIRLRIDADAPELHALPWELLHEADTMLAANGSTPFSRYLPVSEPWGGAVEERPIRVLVVISSPADLEDFYNLLPLDVDLERSTLEQAFLTLDEDDIQLDFLEAPTTLERLEEKLREGYHALHYVGHGVFDRRRQQAALYLQDEEGDTHIVRDEELISMLSRQRVRPRLVFLAACQSATRSTADAFLGLGPRLVAAGVPAVVAMQDLVAIKTARKLSLIFYRRLAEHGMVDCAMNEARSTLLTAGRPDAAVPVLFMRLESGQLWGSEAEGEDTRREATAPEIPPPPEPTPPPEVTGFIGREAELVYFAEKLATSRLAVITGMIGVGKTMLAAKLARQVADPDRIFWHTFHDGEGANTIIWKLAGFLCWRGQEELWRMLQGAQQAGGQPPPPEVLFDYMLQMVRGQRYLLCFDDYHLVGDDPEKDPLLAQLVERLHQSIAEGDLSLIVVSQHRPSFARTGELEPLAGLSLQDTLAFFAHHGLPVPQDQEAGTGTLYTSQALFKMQSLMSADLVANVHARTGGNAQLLTLAVDAFKHTSAPTRLLARMFEDEDIEHFLIREIDDNLSEDERAVMSAVAVLMGYAGTRDAIEAVLDGENVRRTLSDLSQRYLLHVSTGEADREYSLNTVVRHFYYDLLSKRERRTMHHRAGEYYDTEEPDTPKAARHFEQAGEYERAARLATSDVWAAINRGQSRMLRLVLERFTPQQVNPEQWARIKLALGQIQAFLGEGEAAYQSYQETLSSLAALPDSPDVRILRASTCRWLAELHDQRGEFSLALECIGDGLEALEDHETVQAAELALIAFQIHIRQGDYERALVQGQVSLHLGQKLNHVGILARAHNALGLINRRRGARAVAIEHYQQTLKLYRQVNDLIGVAKSHNLIGMAYLDMGQFSAAEHHFHRAYEMFDQLGNAYFCAGLRNNLGLIALKQGRLDEALACYQEGLDLLERTDGSLYLSGLFHNNLGATYIRRNEPDKARQHLRISQAYCEQIEARDFLPELHRLYAEAALLADELIEAEAQGQQSLALACELNMPGEERCTLRVLGEIAIARGQLEQAEAYLNRSLSTSGEVKDVHEWARGQLSLARLHAAQEKPEAALAALDRCTPILEQLGARLDLDSARRLREELAGGGA